MGAYLAFVDESGFLLIPTVRRTDGHGLREVRRPCCATAIAEIAFPRSLPSPFPPVAAGRIVTQYLAGGRGRFHVYRFPAYAPELNPDEYVWNQSKRYMANARPKDIDELSENLRVALGRIGGSQRLLKACLHMSTLSF